jgi:DNA-binding NarL/FixJ family response regulator
VTRVRVLLADDHRIVADGLKRLLEPEFELLSVVEDGRALLAAAKALKPDVIVSDISMPELNGVEALEEEEESGGAGGVRPCTTTWPAARRWRPGRWDT